MKKLYIKSFRDLLKNKFQLLAVMIVVILGSMLFIGFSSTADIEKDYIDKYYSESNLPDLWLYYQSISKEKANELKEIDGVKDILTRYENRFCVDSFEYQSELTLMSLDKSSDISNPYIVSGKLPSDNHDIAIDKEYAKANNIKLGDKIVISCYGYETQVTVTAEVESVEYLVKLPDTLSDIPNHKAYGIGYIKEELYEEEFGMSDSYNEVLIDLINNDDADKIALQAEEMTKDETFLYSAPRELNSSYTMFQSQIEQSISFATLCPVVFFVIAAVMIFITLTNTISRQRKQIGIMKSLGYKNINILTHYITGPAIICVAGSIIGGLIGSYAVPSFMLNAIGGQYDLPDIGIEVYLSNILPSAVLILLCAVVSVALACHKIIRENTASMMRPVSPKDEHKLLIERCNKFWNKLSTSSRVVFRNIFSNKTRTILNAIGIIGSTAVIIVGTGLGDSVDDLLRIQYEEILICDAEVRFNSTVTNDNGSVSAVDLSDIDVPEGTEALPYSDILCRFDSDDNVTYVNLIAFEEQNYDKYYSVQDENGNSLMTNDDGIIISQRLCKKYGYEKGDTVKFKTIDPNFESKDIEAKITDISYQYLTQQIYCTPAFLEKCGITPNPLNMHLIIDENKISYEETENHFLDMPEINSVKSVDKIATDMIEYCSTAIRTVVILVIAAFIISLAVVSCISSINYTERKRNLATMKVMGYSNRNIFGLFVKENIFITIIGLIAGIPLGLVLLNVILEAHETTTCAYPHPDCTSNVIIAFVLVILFTLVANYTVRKKVNKLNMVDNLKNIE